MKIQFLPHALERMKARGISQDEVEKALAKPDESFENDIGPVVHKVLIDQSTSKRYLLRVFYQESATGIEVVSAYKTSKIEKYWRTKDENKL